MPIARIGPVILFFAHIPKTGGSSVEAYLRTKGAVALQFPRRLGWSKSTVQHMHARIHARLVPDDFADASFAVLRDPVDRMVSEYRHRVDRNARQRPFPDFVRAVFDAYERDPYIHDNHIRPQSEFLRDGMALFRIERGLGAVFDWIDTVTETDAVPRDHWEKRAVAPGVEVPDAIAAEIAEFYAADYAVLARLD